MQSKFLLATFVVCLSFCANAQSLLIHLPFSGNANNSGTTTINASISGASLTEDRFGNMESAYSFDGVDDFIAIDNSEVEGFTNNPFTISA